MASLPCLALAQTTTVPTTTAPLSPDTGNPDTLLTDLAPVSATTSPKTPKPSLVGSPHATSTQRSHGTSSSLTSQRATSTPPVYTFPTSTRYQATSSNPVSNPLSLAMNVTAALFFIVAGGCVFFGLRMVRSKKTKNKKKSPIPSNPEANVESSVIPVQLIEEAPPVAEHPVVPPKKNLVIDKKVEIQAAPADVWRIFTDPTITRRIGGEYVSDWKVGGPFGLQGRDGHMYTQGTIVRIEKNALLEHTLFADPESEVVYSTITYELTEHDGTTTLRGREEFQKPVDYTEYVEALNGWEATLKKLKEIVEEK